MRARGRGGHDGRSRLGPVHVIEKLSIPTLLLAADPDLTALIRPEMGDAAVDVNPLISFATVPNGDHSMHRDEYEAFWALVR